MSDTTPVAGSMFTLSATVRNNTDTTIVDVLLTYNAERAVFGEAVSTTTRIAILVAGESLDDSVTVHVPPPGTYEYGAFVRDHNPSTHSHHWPERITVTVQEPPPTPPGTPEPACCPDLVIAKFSVSDTTPVAGSMLTLSATVRNIGTGASRAGADLGYKLGAHSDDGSGFGSQVALTKLPPIAAGESLDDSKTVRVPTSGTYNYSACVEVHGTNREQCSKGIQVTVPPPTPDSSADPRFDDAFWQELVFEQFSNPFTLDQKVIQVLNTTSPNVYIYTGFGHQAIPDEHVGIIRAAIPTAAEQLTGQRYTGRIESGTEHVSERVGWINVRYFTDADGHGRCGFTRVGEDPNSIFLNHDCAKRRGPNAITYLKNVFVHEFGHAMGFMHVQDPNAIMAAVNNWLANPAATFSAREQFHAQLAYRVGRGARYCGWPLSAECE